MRDQGFWVPKEHILIMYTSGLDKQNCKFFTVLRKINSNIARVSLKVLFFLSSMETHNFHLSVPNYDLNDTRRTLPRRALWLITRILTSNYSKGAIFDEIFTQVFKTSDFYKGNRGNSRCLNGYVRKFIKCELANNALSGLHPHLIMWKKFSAIISGLFSIAH